VAHGYAPPNAIFKHETGNRSCKKVKAPEPQLRGRPSGRRGTSALRPSWRRYWHRNCACQSQRLGGGTSRVFFGASAFAVGKQPGPGTSGGPLESPGLFFPLPGGPGCENNQNAPAAISESPRGHRGFADGWRSDYRPFWVCNSSKKPKHPSVPRR
jgi:hypothetical protein